MGVSKLPRGRYVVTSVLGNNKTTVEGKDIKDPITRARFQQQATPYTAGKKASAAAEVADFNKRFLATTSANASRAADRADARERLKTSQVSQSQRYPSAPAPKNAPQAPKPAPRGQTTQMGSTPSRSLSKGSTSAPAYSGQAGDSVAKRGNVTSYVKSGLDAKSITPGDKRKSGGR